MCVRNVYASQQCIPFKDVLINTLEPPWMRCDIKRLIRKRKRAYKKVKSTNSDHHWAKFRELRNSVVTLIRQHQTEYYDNLALKLKSSELSSKDWWRILKSFITSSSSSSVVSLSDPLTDELVTGDTSKSIIINDFFVQQTNIDDSNHVLPRVIAIENQQVLESIVIQPSEVTDVIKCLVIGKASGPDGISNRVLVEVSSQLSIHLCDLFNLSLISCKIPSK